VEGKFGLEILDGIGSTEILHIFISNRPGSVKPGSSGMLVPGYEAKVLDNDGNPVPAGEIGTLLVKGDSIASCYWNKHQKDQRNLYR
jgi:Acyl-coenzyme A synthetases/AMP-(fatty) acid ligases